MSRSLKGCYVYIVDEQTRDFVKSRIDRYAPALAAEEQTPYAE